MRTNLAVPFADKDEAKKLGARWDPAKKLWYIENVDIAPFSKWLGNSIVGHDSSTAQVKKSSVKKNADSSEGITTVGSKFVQLPRVCSCLAWETCGICQSAALNC